jgi:hypothetical protein
MSMKRENGRVLIDIGEDDFEILIFLMGLGAGTAQREGSTGLFWRFISLANAVNEGNPNWTPYEVPAEPGTAL